MVAALALLVFCLPLVATGPILRVLFGPGDGPQVTLAALAVYYTTFLPLLVGLRAAPASWFDLVRSYGRGRLTELVQVRAARGAALSRRRAADRRPGGLPRRHGRRVHRRRARARRADDPRHARARRGRDLGAGGARRRGGSIGLRCGRLARPRAARRAAAGDPRAAGRAGRRGRAERAAPASAPCGDRGARPAALAGAMDASI